MRKFIVLSVALLFPLGCASSGRIDSLPAAKTTTNLDDWTHVERLSKGMAIRVTQKDGERIFGHVMSISAMDIKLELRDASKTIARSDVRLVERFPRSFPRSVSGAAVGVGAALALSSSSSPQGYYESVAPASQTLDKSDAHVRNGYYVNAVELVGSSIDRIASAIESTRRALVVYQVEDPQKP